MTERNSIKLPTGAELEELFYLKHGDPKTTGWSPRQLWRFGYFTPADVYEALVNRLVTADTDWLDVGCGRFLFPSNPALAKKLSGRCNQLVGIDPDETIEENECVHEKVRATIDDFELDKRFDLVTLNMVAEHIANPERAITKISKSTRPGGYVVIHTVFKYSPVPIVTVLTPHRWHHKAKAFLWSSESKDTFPVENKMNTRGTLRRLFERAGFREAHFSYVDDCRSFARFRLTSWMELAVQRALRRIGLHYPEVNLLGVYEKRAD